MNWLDKALWLAPIAVEAAVIALLFYRRIWRILPVFSLYCCFDLTANLAVYIRTALAPSSYGINVYLVQIGSDTLFQLAVLIELGWSVLRPLWPALSRRSIFIVVLSILLFAAALWPFTASSFGHQSHGLNFLFHLSKTVALVRLILLLVLVAFSHWLSLSWRDRELQVATGFGAYALASVLATLLADHFASEKLAIVANRFVIGVYLGSLVYWCFSFAQPSVSRRSFTPHMRDLLLAVAGFARTQRGGLK
ncbi:MAG TPA: hypothetical protein VG893_14810 [Terracidiphilus sp.]|nr:hypothetical protein [Terracidiphilus sp.]